MEPGTATTTCMKFSKHFLDGQFKQCILKPHEFTTATKKLRLPAGYTTRLALPEESPVSFKENELCIYLDQVKIGLTWNNLEVVTEILKITKFTLAMLAPNCVYTIITLYAFCLKHKIDWSPDVFLYLFKFVPVSYYVTCKPRNADFFRTCNLLDSIASWKQKYFFITSANGWAFSTKPGYASVDVISQPICPASLDQWLDNNKQDIYILDVLTCDLYSGTVKLDTKTAGSKMARGKRASQVDRTSSKKQKRQSSDSSDSSDSDSHSGAGSAASLSKSKEKEPSYVDIIGNESPVTEGNKVDTKIPEGPRVFRGNTSKAPTDQDKQENISVPAYFINSKGNLELDSHGDISLQGNLFDPFGTVLANFNKSPQDTRSFQQLSPEDFMACQQNMLLLVSRMSTHMSDACNGEHMAKLKWKKEYNKTYSLYMDSLKQIENLEKQAPDLHKSCNDDIATIQSLLDATEEIKNKVVAENVQLKASLDQKDIEMEQLRSSNAELKRQLEQKSDFQSLTAEEQFEIVRTSHPCEKEMVFQLTQGFEKYRRAALRRITDPPHLSIINEIDFYTANDEEETSDSDEEEPAADEPDA